MRCVIGQRLGYPVDAPNTRGHIPIFTDMHVQWMRLCSRCAFVRNEHDSARDHSGEGEEGSGVWGHACILHAICNQLQTRKNAPAFLGARAEHSITWTMEPTRLASGDSTGSVRRWHKQERQHQGRSQKVRTQLTPEFPQTSGTANTVTNCTVGEISVPGFVGIILQ